MSKEVDRIRSLIRMAREEGVDEMAVGTVSFKLAPKAAPAESSPEPEEIEPVEAIARELEQDGLLVDRKALTEFLEPPQKRGRS